MFEQNTTPPHVATEQMFKDGYNRCIALLSRREHSVLELTQKLSQQGCGQGYNQEVIENIIAKLISLNYQSDERFAEVFCRSRVSKKNGSRKVRYELQQKGIDDHLINREIAKYPDEFLANAISLIERKAPRGDISAIFADFKLKDKISKSLFNKGYDFDTIKQAFEIIREEYL